MRIGASSVHQGLTPEAAAIVKSAVSLARRRGHAQVTPLHVASATMADPTGLLKAACLRSHSHPLQCKALELCFNVALNRLPTGGSNGPLFLGSNRHHYHHPSFSNALVAAFKRAQSHQRRGSIENQQQPILAVKIELEQLVISILDDPSVSRVMREAGFSSPQVKNNVEQAVVSLELCSSSSVVKTEQKETTIKFKHVDDQACEEDVNAVLDSLMGTKKRNTVVVGENLANAVSIMSGVIGKLERGDVRFVNVPVLSLRNMSIEEVQQKIGELRCLVNGYEARWVVLYLGDLKWVSEFWSNYGEQSRTYYSPTEFMIMELSRLLCGVGERSGKKLCLMGIANLQTFMRCKSGHPSLETLWQLHPLTVPVIGSLGLSLNFHDHSDLQSKELRNDSGWLLVKMVEEKRLNCCSDCRENFKREAWSIEMSNAYHNESTTTSTCSSLPSWLKTYKEDQNKRKTIINSDKDFDKLKDLCKKWNSICRSVHKQPHFLESPFIFSSSSPNSSSSSVSSHKDNDQSKKRLHETISTWPLIFGPNPSQPENKPDLLSNPNSSPNSASCSEANDDNNDDDDDDDNNNNKDHPHSFKEFNPENLKALSRALEKKVPWHKDIIPDISTTLFQSRSGMLKRNNGQKEETWLSFLGVDQKGKEMIAKEIARLVFGSYKNFITIGLTSGLSTTIADSSEEYIKKKRMRVDHEPGSSYLDRFAKVVKENPSRVFFVEEVEQVDYNSQLGIKKAIESGRITVSNGEIVPLKDAIVIFSCDSFSSLSRACSPPTIEGDGNIESEGEIGVSGALDLNIGGDEDHDDQLVSSIGLIMDSIDRQIIFKIQVL